jgi:hypothetical protein
MHPLMLGKSRDGVFAIAMTLPASAGWTPKVKVAISVFLPAGVGFPCLFFWLIRHFSGFQIMGRCKTETCTPGFWVSESRGAWIASTCS